MTFYQFVWIECDSRCGRIFESQHDGRRGNFGFNGTRHPGDNRRLAAEQGWTHSRKYGDRCSVCSQTIVEVRQWNEKKARS